MDLDLNYKDYELDDYNKNEILEIKNILQSLTVSESIDYLSGVLCAEWNTYYDQLFIVEVLYLLDEKIRISRTS